MCQPKNGTELLNVILNNPLSNIFGTVKKGCHQKYHRHGYSFHGALLSECVTPHWHQIASLSPGKSTGHFISWMMKFQIQEAWPAALKVIMMPQTRQLALTACTSSRNQTVPNSIRRCVKTRGRRREREKKRIFMFPVMIQVVCREK